MREHHTTPLPSGLSHFIAAPNVALPLKTRPSFRNTYLNTEPIATHPSANTAAFVSHLS